MVNAVPKKPLQGTHAVRAYRYHREGAADPPFEQGASGVRFDCILLMGENTASKTNGKPTKV